MKVRVLLIMLFFSSGIVHAQNFEDGFEDGDFSENPAWSGTTTKFVVDEDNSNFLIRLNDTQADTAFLSTPSTEIVGFWEFFVQIDGSAPSNTNRAEIYLMSDRMDLNGAVNGYILRIGETGDDVFSVIRVDAGQQSEIILSDTTIFQAGGGYRIRVERTALGEWSLQTGVGYNGELKDSGQRAMDATYTSASHFGFRVIYTSSRTDDYYFDFKIKEPPVIIAPFYIDRLVSTDSQRVDLFFSRDVHTPVDAENFELDGDLAPSSVLPLTPNQLQLVFDTPLNSGPHELLIREVQSANLDTSITDTTITFFRFDEYVTGDVMINEFLKDPPSGSGLPEYVELINASSKFLNLKNWQVADNGSNKVISEDDLILHPDSFLVLTPDPDLLAADFGDGYYWKVALPTLNNTSDQIRLFERNGLLVDSLAYNSDWGGVDVALERRSVFVSSTLQANWGDSPNEIGTPGNRNEIETDTTSPFIEDIDIPANNRINVIFSEEIDLNTATDPVNYQLNGGEIAADITVIANTVSLLLEVPLMDGVTSDLLVSGVVDYFGNRMQQEIIPITYYKFGVAIRNEVVINEFMYLRADEDTPEFVELLNNTSKNFDLSGWSLTDGAGNRAYFGSGSILPKSEYFTVTDSELFADEYRGVHYISSFPSLNDRGDAIVLRDHEGAVIDSLFYNEFWGGESGRSVERKDPEAASNDASNWDTSENENGHSVNAKNSVFEPDVAGPRIRFASVSGDSVQVVFSEFVDLSHSSTGININSKTPMLIEFDVESANLVTLQVEEIAKDEPVLLEITALSDIKGNITDRSTTEVAQQIESGKVFINEIMFDPISDPDDNLEDQVEYVELYNAAGHRVSLEGVVIHDKPDENGEIQIIIPDTRYKWIESGGYSVIYASEENMKSEQPVDMDTDPASIPYEDAFSIQVERSSLSLSATEDAVYLANSEGSTIDSVWYDESWHNPNLPSTKGRSLEKINPVGPSNDPGNWGTSTDPSGGSWLIENTLYQRPGAAPEQTGISFSPNPFSPDADGFEDNLFLNYALDASDYLLRVRIFDRYGREVKKLADGEPAGFNGTLIWDGLNEAGKVNRVGIYIVLFEAYNSANNKNLTIKKPVVLARKF